MTNYEVGVKGLYLDGTMQLAATYFYQDFDKYWVFASRLSTPAELAIDPTSITSGEVSAIGGTTVSGIELEGAWRLTDSTTTWTPASATGRHCILSLAPVLPVVG